MKEIFYFTSPISLTCAFLVFFSLTSCSDRTFNETKEAADPSKSLPPAEQKPFSITFEQLKHRDRKTTPPNEATTPEEIKKLAGKEVEIHGYLSPCFLSEQRHFVLAVTPIIEPSYQPLADEYVAVSLKEDWESSNTPIQRVKVSGTFRIENVLNEQNGKVLAFYHLDNAAMQIDQKPK